MKKNKIFIISAVIVIIILVSLISWGAYKKTSKIKKYYPPINKALLNDALSYGKKNAYLNTYQFSKPWTINLGYEDGQGYATLCTPFLRLALLERDAVRNKETLDPNLERKIYNQEIGIIHFLVTMYGNSPTFSKRIKAYLIYKKKVIKPEFIYFPLYGQMGREYTQISSGEIKFPKENISNNAIVTLIVKTLPNPSYKWENNAFWKKSHTAKFKFNLAKYR
jgi:hypothetical protein